MMENAEHCGRKKTELTKTDLIIIRAALVGTAKHLPTDMPVKNRTAATATIKQVQNKIDVLLSELEMPSEASNEEDLHGYESFEEAWKSGYNAALHDIECYIAEDRPRWIPRAIWWRWSHAVIRAWVRRGDDL